MYLFFHKNTCYRFRNVLTKFYKDYGVYHGICLPASGCLDSHNSGARSELHHWLIEQSTVSSLISEVRRLKIKRQHKCSIPHDTSDITDFILTDGQHSAVTSLQLSCKHSTFHHIFYWDVKASLSLLHYAKVRFYLMLLITKMTNICKCTIRNILQLL